MMPSPQQRCACEFRLLRYVPDAVRNEYVHIGVMLREQGSRHMEVRFTRDWRRVRCLDPDADTGLLEAMETELRRRLATESDAKLMRILEESLSLGVQMTESKAYLAESLPAGLEELMRLYVDPPPREKLPRLSGRAAIHARMRSEFEHAGVWDLLRKRIVCRGVHPARRPAADRSRLPAQWHHPHVPRGQPGAGRGDGQGAGLSAGALRAGVERVEKASLELTAIIEPAANSAPPTNSRNGWPFTVSALRPWRSTRYACSPPPTSAAWPRRRAASCGFDGFLYRGS